MNQFSFQYPEAFLLLLLFYICAKWCPARSMAIYFPHLKVLLGGREVKSRIPAILKWIGITMLITALSSPVLTDEYKNTKKRYQKNICIKRPDVFHQLFLVGKIEIYKYLHLYIYIYNSV